MNTVAWLFAVPLSLTVIYTVVLSVLKRISPHATFGYIFLMISFWISVINIFFIRHPDVDSAKFWLIGNALAAIIAADIFAVADSENWDSVYYPDI